VLGINQGLSPDLFQGGEQELRLFASKVIVKYIFLPLFAKNAKVNDAINQASCSIFGRKGQRVSKKGIGKLAQTVQHT